MVTGGHGTGRQETLRDKWRFVCSCARCVEGEGGGGAEPDRRLIARTPPAAGGAAGGGHKRACGEDWPGASQDEPASDLAEALQAWQLRADEVGGGALGAAAARAEVARLLGRARRARLAESHWEVLRLRERAADLLLALGAAADVSALRCSAMRPARPWGMLRRPVASSGAASRSPPSLPPAQPPPFLPY
jgi:hypothetical protein